MGFGASLIAKLKEPGGIKQNLYYEIKDRVIEEVSDAFGRVVRRKQRTKVYGLDSSKDMRDLLIEILRERMERHKDKFNSPVLLDELSKMVVKRNGKVEHSENSHDDLVFSLLMALYVWYEGKNIKENFHINKVPIKTEDSVDDIVGADTDLEKKYVEIIEELKLPEEDEQKTLKEMNESLKVLKQGMGTMFGDFIKQQRVKENELLMNMLQNKAAREAYSKYYHIPLQETESMVGGQFTLPNSLFTNFGMDPNELSKKQVDENMNFKNFNPGN